jgi:copper oxidase (laccase) domain-containing protein
VLGRPGLKEKCHEGLNLSAEVVTGGIAANIMGNKEPITKDKLLSFIKDQLRKSGIKKENIEDTGICTGCSPDFFSHFRSLRKNKTEGRFAAIIGMG